MNPVIDGTSVWQTFNGAWIVITHRDGKHSNAKIFDLEKDAHAYARRQHKKGANSNATHPHD